MKTKLSIVDIAKKAHVSTATVSRVLNDKGGYSEKTKEIILSIVKESKFSLDPYAIGLRTKKSNTVGVVIPDITNEFFARIARALDVFFLKHNYSLFICSYNEDIKLEELHIQKLIDKSIDGIIYISAQNHVRNIKKANAPIVYIDRRPENADILITSDNFHGGYLAGKELIEKGCTDIILIRDKNGTAVDKRAEGFYVALQEVGIQCKKEVCVASPDFTHAREEIKKIIETEGRFFDGVFATNDMMALGCMNYMLERGYNIPNDVKLVGYDGTSSTQFCSPPMTTIAQDMDSMAHHAGRLLLDMMQGKEVIAKQVIVPVNMIVRQST